MGAGFAREEVDAALARARDLSWIDDRAFARLWVEDRLLHHPLSRRAVEDELRGRRVALEVILATLDERYPRERERDVALELARGRLDRLAGRDEATQARRVADFLTRRGFSVAVAVDSTRRAMRGGGESG